MMHYQDQKQIQDHLKINLHKQILEEYFQEIKRLILYYIIGTQFISIIVMEQVNII